MPNRYFAAIWLFLLSLPLFFLIIYPIFASLNVELDQKLTDSYIFKDKYDLENPISYDFQWSVSFSLKGYPWGYLVWPKIPYGGNWSASTSQGAFIGNFSIYLNGEFSYEFQIILTVPYDPDPTWVFVEIRAPSLEDIKYVVDFSSMRSGENNLTVKCHLYSIIERPGKANMDLHIGPFIVDITGLKGSDGIPDIVQPFPGLNAYFLTLFCGIIFLPVAEAIRYYGKRLIRQLRSS
ncbi:MAG: hypothetical protein ACFFC6_10475 [Promethearchaeota archaeon]